MAALPSLRITDGKKSRPGAVLRGRLPNHCAEKDALLGICALYCIAICKWSGFKISKNWTS
jgi:hypothetical protein